MKPRLLILAALLSTLRATGANVTLSPDETVTLKSIDALPTKAEIDLATQTSAGLDRLLAIAMDSTIDLGIQIRSIRLLPLYCPEPGENCSGTPIHDTLLSLVQSYVTALRQISPAGLPPQDVLRLRAAVEALGVTRSALSTDVDALTQDPLGLLHHPSRDVRVTVVISLRNLGSCAAIAPLQMLLSTETTAQVQKAILSALQGLQMPGMCS